MGGCFNCRTRYRPLLALIVSVLLHALAHSCALSHSPVLSLRAGCDVDDIVIDCIGMDGINGTTFSEQMRLRRRLVLDANDYHPVHTSNRHLGANTTTTTTNLAAAGPNACLAEDGRNGITCWMQCMALPTCTNTADSIQCLDLAKTPPSSPLALGKALLDVCTCVRCS